MSQTLGGRLRPAARWLGDECIAAALPISALPVWFGWPPSLTLRFGAFMGPCAAATAHNNRLVDAW